VYVELASANGGMMRDLSEEGFAVRAMMPLRAGEKTPYQFSLDEHIQIEGQGQILWVQENGHVAGVGFEGLSAAARKQIREWLARPERPARREQPAGSESQTFEELRAEMYSVPPRPEGKSPVEAPATPVVHEPAIPAKPPPMPSVSPPREEKTLSETPGAASAVAGSVEPPVPERAVTAKEPDRKPVPLAPEERIPVELPTPAVPKLPEPVVPEPRVTAKEPQPAPTKEPKRVAITPPTPIPIETAPAPSVPVASVTALHAPTLAQPERPLEPVHPLEAERPTENLFEEPAAPALPRLTLTPKAVDPRLEPIASALPLAQKPALEEHWEPAPLVDVSASSTQAGESEPVLPDISAILIQPQGRAQRPVPPFVPLEGPSSWDAEARSAESRRFSLSGAVMLMTILALLAGLYVFHKEVGQGLIWLGEALGGVPRTAAPATSSEGVAGRPLETPSAPPYSSSGQTSPAANSGASEKAPTATGPGDMNPASTNRATASASSPMVPPVGVNPPRSSNVDAGQSEYAQAMQLLRGTNAEAAMPEALRLLWISVEKGNANAELQLAEMYWRGHGVVRNCDQALILLTAAARKGSADAQKRLLEFQKEGCE